jgi:hypothetical protein
VSEVSSKASAAQTRVGSYLSRLNHAGWLDYRSEPAVEVRGRRPVEVVFQLRKLDPRFTSDFVAFDVADLLKLAVETESEVVRRLLRPSPGPPPTG